MLEPMVDDAERGVPTWAVVSSALLAPILIALVFKRVFGQINELDVITQRSGPGVGQMISDRNNALMLAHAMMQVAFVALGAWRITRRQEIRSLFLVIAIPVAAIAFLAELMSEVAG
jgi:hypothetical protein